MKRIYFLLALALAVSCNSSKPEGKPIINLVGDIITDVNNPQHSLVADYNEADPAKSIYVAGAPERCKPILMSLKSCDGHDNGDGRFAGDGLPDFSGEVICTILDFANTPYDRFLREGKEDKLKEITVRTVLSAMASVLGGSSSTGGRVGAAHAISYGLSNCAPFLPHSVAVTLAMLALKDVYPDGYAETLRFHKISRRELPRASAYGLSEADIPRMTATALGMEKLWQSCFGPERCKELATPKYISSVYRAIVKG